MESHTNFGWTQITLLGIVAVVAIATMTIPQYKADTQSTTQDPASTLLGMAYAGTLPLIDQSASDAHCPDGSIELSGGVRWCCRTFSDAVQCSQLDVPEEGQACPISDDGASEWSNSFYTATSTCTSPGCQGSTSTDYESYRIETHILLLCIDGDWVETGRCISETRRSCLDDGPRTRCESEVCGESMEWWIQPRAVSDAETTQSGDACAESEGVIQQTQEAVDKFNNHVDIPRTQPVRSLAAEHLLPHCQALR